MKLRFYDHHRQSYGALPIRDGADAEFMIGDYTPDGLQDGGEFRIALKNLQDGRGGRQLHAQLQVFGDASGSLIAAIDAGLLDAIKDTVASRDEFSERLISIGISDRSDNPIGSGDPVCHCCGQAVRSLALTSREPQAQKEN